MSNSPQGFTRGDGSFDVFGAMERGDMLRRHRINAALRGALARIGERIRQALGPRHPEAARRGGGFKAG